MIAIDSSALSTGAAVAHLAVALYQAANPGVPLVYGSQPHLAAQSEALHEVANLGQWGVNEEQLLVVPTPAPMPTPTGSTTPPVVAAGS